MSGHQKIYTLISAAGKIEGKKLHYIAYILKQTKGKFSEKFTYKR
ncbi:MAG: hypothetical protein ACOC4Y_01890 [bacterium]